MDQEHEYKAAREDFINPSELTAFYTGWNDLYQQILDYTLIKQ